MGCIERFRVQKRRFIKNVLDYANQILGEDIFHQKEWDRYGQWNEKLGRHEQYLIPRNDVWFEGRCLKVGEKIFVVASHKYDDEGRDELWKAVGLRTVDGWQVTETKYGMLFFAPRNGGANSNTGLYILSARGASFA